jgi:hypothetical protein
MKATVDIICSRCVNAMTPCLLCANCCYRQTSFALGNQRPDFLMSTERALWKSLFNICRGSSAVDELQGFLDEFRTMEIEYGSGDNEYDWFVLKGKSPNSSYVILLFPGADCHHP